MLPTFWMSFSDFYLNWRSLLLRMRLSYQRHELHVQKPLSKHGGTEKILPETCDGQEMPLSFGSPAEVREKGYLNI